jgi:hypothetical protein
MDVIRCESAEAAELVIANFGFELRLLVTDVRLAGDSSGIELAQFAKEQFPKLKVVVVSGEEGLAVPRNVRFLKMPFSPLDLLHEAMH